MPDSIMYSEDAYVVLENDRPDLFLTPEELLAKLSDILRSHPEAIPRELLKFSTIEEQARYLRDNYCDLDLAEGEYLQWYVVRLEK